MACEVNNTNNNNNNNNNSNSNIYQFLFAIYFPNGDTNKIDNIQINDIGTYVICKMVANYNNTEL